MKRYLERVREFRKDRNLYDCHVHPFEVLFCEDDRTVPGRGGWPDASCGFAMPEIGAITEAQDGLRNSAERFKRSAQVLSLRSRYRNPCPECFLSHMAAASVDVSLLLPIASGSEEAEPAMSRVAALFGRDKRFVLGCSIPNTIENSEIDPFLSRMESLYGVKAVKLHHNITGIDLAADWGKERTDAILDGCRKSGLPLVVHGGRSNAVKEAAARGYARMANLKEIDWSASGRAVVISHGGAYECGSLEVKEEVLPALGRLLLRHDNLLVDLSGLDCETQIRFLRKIGPERVVFGSDALYGPPWREAAKLVFSLEKAGCNVERGFLMIGSETPEKHLFERMKGHVRGSPPKALSNH